jgi:hypothetical protein
MLIGKDDSSMDERNCIGTRLRGGVAVSFGVSSVLLYLAFMSEWVKREHYGCIK